MSRRARIVWISIGAIVLIAAIAVMAAIKIARSAWLREKFRERIVAEAERATGGRIEIGAFQLEWSTLTAEIDNLIVHGTEPAGEAPLLSVRRVMVGFRIISLFKRELDVARVDAEGPQAHLIVRPDGTTNLLRPRMKRSIPETIVALRIGKFDLSNGMLTADRAGTRSVSPWSARGRNIAAKVTWNGAGSGYDGDVSIAPFSFTWNGSGQVTAEVTATASMEKNRIAVSRAVVKTGGSEIDLSDATLDNFTAPVTTAQYRARISLADADRIFKLVNFRHAGTVNATGRIRYISPRDYTVTGAVEGSGIAYGKIRDVRIAANLAATPGSVAVNGLRMSALGGEIAANGEVRNLDTFHLAGQLQRFDAGVLADLIGLAPPAYDGIISGPFDAAGRLKESDFHRIVASAMLNVSPTGGGEPLHGEVNVKYDGPADTIELGRSWLELPKTRADVAGVLGRRLEVKLESQDLRELLPALRRVSLPVRLENGSVAFEGTVSGSAGNVQYAGHAAIRNAIWEGQKVDSLSGDFTATQRTASVGNAVLAWGNLRAQVTGSIGLTDWKANDASAVNANVRIANADLTRVAALAGGRNLPLTGTLNITGRVTGTVGDPHATADLTLAKGQIYGEPYDSATGRAQYVNGGAQLLTAAIDAGRNRLNITAQFDHSPTTFLAGKLTFAVSSNALALNQIALVSRREPGIRGTAQIKAGGALEINRANADVLNLNAELNATGLGQGTSNLGDLHFTAQTAGGVMTMRLDSNAVKAAIHGEGTVRLAGDYPVDARLTFADIGLNAAAAAMMPQRPRENFDGSIAGEIALRGSAKTPDLITASLEMPKFELHPLAIGGDAKNVPNLPNLALTNNGPIRATLANSVVHIESARFQAPSTTLEVSGTVNLRDPSPLNLRVAGNMNLALAQSFDADLMPTGELSIDAGVRGTYTAPELSGRAEMQKGDFHYAGFGNGLTNANALLSFSGTRVTIQSFTAESGGGKVDVTGFAALTGGMLAFRVEAKTHGVRIRYPQGVSTVSDSDVTLAGTSERSQASGTVTVHRISINPKSDVSAILESAAQPLKTPAANQGFLANMNLDVAIETAPDVAFETSVAQSIEADANLRLRGTLLNPAVLGRINITQGEMVFFGNKYTINQGSVSFFNPARIDPVLNIDLETRARGVVVTLTLSGPIGKLNLSYRSVPPLQWADVVALLATGRSPTSPTLAAQNTGESQNLQQLGASGLIGQAMSNPMGGNLQRFFGVSRIKIDPQLIGITGSQAARLTIEQQVSPDLLFTYVSDVSNTSTQLFQVEWDLNRKWSAILTREENGYVGVSFAYRKRFK